jgi:RNA polymerase-binding transcription factor DksA
MLSVDDIRKKLLTQRRNLFRQTAQTEDELLWLETDVESESQERGQEERRVQLLDRLDERMKVEIEAIDQVLQLPARWRLRPEGPREAL